MLNISLTALSVYNSPCIYHHQLDSFCGSIDLMRNTARYLLQISVFFSGLWVQSPVSWSCLIGWGRDKSFFCVLFDDTVTRCFDVGKSRGSRRMCCSCLWRDTNFVSFNGMQKQAHWWHGNLLLLLVECCLSLGREWMETWSF